MKYLISFFIFTFFFQSLITAQQTDENTLAINNYFQNSDKESDMSSTALQNSNIQSFISTIQFGNENSIYVNSLQTGDQQVVNQKGNQNNYEYYNYYSTENSNMIINQEGNKNSLLIFGENSLMKNAIINQKSSSKSMVIKNYTN